MDASTESARGGHASRRSACRIRRAAPRLALWAALLAGAWGIAAPASADVLVSNIGKTSTSSGLTLGTSLDVLQGFDTGPHQAGYTLTSIELSLKTFTGTVPPTVIVTDGTTPVTLTGPASLTANTTANYTFTTATSTTTVLSASTTYSVIAEGGSLNEWEATASDDEDASSATGWSINNLASVRNAADTGGFVSEPEGYAVKLRVNGAEVGANNAPTASDGEVTVDEDGAYTFAAGDFGFMDADSDDTLDKVTIVSLPGAGKGTLKIDNKPIPPGHLPEEIEASELGGSNGLIYEPPDDENGNDYATFNFKVSDGDDESASSYTMTIDVDSVPDVTRVAVTSAPLSGTATPKDIYGLGEKIQVTVTFDEAVTVTDDPHVEVEAGDDTRNAVYARGSMSTALVFEYTVVDSDSDPNGIDIKADVKLDEDSGSEDHIRDSDGNDADLTFAELTSLSAHKVDGGLARLAPPSPDALISNMRQPSDNTTILSSADLAQSFETGGNSAGYTVTGVAFHMDFKAATSTEPSYGVSIWTESSGNPGAKVGDLGTVTKSSTQPNRLASNADGINVAPNTTYFVVLDSNLTGGGTNIRTATSDLEDSGGKSGWSLGNVHLTRPADSSGSWSPDAEMSSLNVTVRGAVNQAEAISHDLELEVEEGGTVTFEWTPPGTPTAESPVELKLFYWSLGHVTVEKGTVTATDTNPVTFRLKANQDDDWEDGMDMLWVARRAPGMWRTLGYVYVTVRDDDPVGPGESNGCSAAPSGAFWSACMAVGYGGRGRGFEALRPRFTDSGQGALSKTAVDTHEIDGILDKEGVTLSFAADPRPDPDSWVVKLGGSSFNFSDAKGFAEPREGWLFASPSNGYLWDAASQGWSKGDKVTVSLFDIPKPAGVSATPGDAQATLSWTAPSGSTSMGTVTGYEVRVCKGAAADCEGYTLYGQPVTYTGLFATGSTTPSWTVTRYANYSGEEYKLENGVTYTAQVRAVTGNGKGGWSDELEFAPTDNLQVLAPPAPTIVSATPGGRQVTLAWVMREEVEGITGWRLRYGSVNVQTGAVDWSEWTDIEGAGADTREHTVTGLTDGTPYAFELRAMVGELEGTASAGYSMFGVLPEVTGLEATPADGAVQLSWTAPSVEVDIAGWQVRWKAAGAAAWGEWTDIEDSAAGTAGHTVTGLENGTRYAFGVRAMSAGAWPLAESGTVEAWAGGPPPPGPPGLVAEPGDGQVALTWTQPESAEPITGWQLRYGASGADDAEPDWGEWTDIEGATAGTREHAVTGLENGTQYAFELRAVAGGIEGEPSVRRLAQPEEPEIPPIQHMEVASVTATTVRLEWTLPEGVAVTRLRAMQRQLAETGEWPEWEEAATLEVDANAYTVTGLSPATRYQFRILLETATQSTDSGIAQLETLAVDPLRTRMSGSAPGGRCAMEVSVAFLDADGNAVAVDALAASDFAVTNGRAGTPVADADGLGWTAPVQANEAFAGLMRVRLPATDRWEAAEQVFRVEAECAPVARTALASLRLEGMELEPAFDLDTHLYRVAVPRRGEHATVDARAVYDAAAVSISPSDDDSRSGHQVPLRRDLRVHVIVTAGDESSTYTINGYPSEVLTGFELVDASTDADLGPIANGGTVSVSADGRYGIRAEVDADGDVGSVVLSLAGPGEADTHTQTENIAPYSLYGDANGAEYGRALAAGSYTLTSTAYAERGATGDVLDTLTVPFTVTVEAPAPEPLAATGLTASGATRTSLELAWTLPEQPDGVTVTDVQVQREAGGSWSTVATLAADATSHTATGLDAGTSYRFRIRIATNEGNADSETFTASTHSAVLTGFVLVDVSDQSRVATLSDDATVDLGARFDADFGVRAEVAGGAGIGSVALSLSGAKAVSRTENIAPYSLYGDANTGAASALYGEALPAGSYTLSATAYAGSGASGNVLDTQSVSFTVRSPAALSVKDASAEEGTDASLEFVVELDREAQGAVTVQYATADGTATAGEDYTAASGTLSFASGETTKTVLVSVLDDQRDEGQETFTLTLSSASGAVIADGTATGTITNTDPMPQAWLARFGRAASDNVVQAITRRWDGGAAGAVKPHFTIGGRRIGGGFGERTGAAADYSHAGPWEPDVNGGEARAPERAQGHRQAPGRGRMAGARGQTLPDSARGGPAGGRVAVGRTTGGNDFRQALDAVAGSAGDAQWARIYREGMALANGAGRFGLRDLLMNSSFYYSPAAAAADDSMAARSGWLGDWAVWGESAATHFSGADGELGLSGEVSTALVSFDSRRGRWLAGLALAYTEGTGTYAHPRSAAGELSSTLRSLHPYVHWRLNERTGVWGLVGYGTGEMSLIAQGAGPIETDLRHTLAAFGGRTALTARAGETGRFELALRSDAQFTETVSEAVPGLLGAAGATSRVRVMLEGTGSLSLAGGELTPTLEAGLRYDAGDAETGAGLEVGGGLAYASGALRVALNARALVMHRDSAYEEWGFGASVAYEPSPDGQGLSMNLGSTWGAVHGGVQSLWSQPAGAGLSPAAVPLAAGPQLQAQLGYGISGRNGQALWVPYVGTYGASDLHAGLKLSSGEKVQVALEIGRAGGAMHATGTTLPGAGVNPGTGPSAHEREPLAGAPEQRPDGPPDGAGELALQLNWTLRW